jgi:hypothetical protein
MSNSYTSPRRSLSSVAAKAFVATVMILSASLVRPAAASAWSCPQPQTFMPHWNAMLRNPSLVCKAKYQHGNYIVVAVEQMWEYDAGAQGCSGFGMTLWGVFPNNGNVWGGTSGLQNSPVLNTTYQLVVGSNTPQQAWANIVWSCSAIILPTEGGESTVSRLGVSVP